MILCLLLFWFQTARSPAQEHARRGYELFQKGELKPAEAELREATRLSPNDAISLALLGGVLARQNRLKEARVYLEKAVAIDPADSGTRYNLAAVQFQLGDSRAAKMNLERILRSRPDHKASIALGHQAALAEYRANRFADSQATVEGLIAAGVRKSEVFNLLAWSFHRQNKLTEAVGAMRQAIELDPSVETNYDNLAQILLEQKENVAAADVIRKALEVAPDSFQVYKLKGRMETQIGNFKRALESFSRAVALNVTDAESLLGLGLVQEKLAQLDQAAATFEKGIARFPRDAQFYQAYGRMLAESGTRLDSAVTLFEKALEIDNALPEAHYHLGKLLLAKGKAQESLPHLEAAAKLDPKSSRIHLSLANAYRSLGRQDDAARELKLVRELQEK